MVGIRTRLGVAACRTRKEYVVGRIDVAVRALRVAVGQTEPSSMVEQRTRPGRGGVASFAGGREPSADVIRICRG